MIAIKNVSNKECIESLNDFFNSDRTFTIYLIGENNVAAYDYDPTVMKKEFPKVESKLTMDLHGIIEHIQKHLDDFWFGNSPKSTAVTLFNFYILMEYLQMIEYRNPGINFDNQTIIVCHLRNDLTKEIHCQIVGSSPLHPSDSKFLETAKLVVNKFFDYH